MIEAADVFVGAPVGTPPHVVVTLQVGQIFVLSLQVLFLMVVQLLALDVFPRLPQVFICHGMIAIVTFGILLCVAGGHGVFPAFGRDTDRGGDVSEVALFFRIRADVWLEMSETIKSSAVVGTSRLFLDKLAAVAHGGALV